MCFPWAWAYPLVLKDCISACPEWGPLSCHPPPPPVLPPTICCIPRACWGLASQKGLDPSERPGGRGAVPDSRTPHFAAPVLCSSFQLWREESRSPPLGCCT